MIFIQFPLPSSSDMIYTNLIASLLSLSPIYIYILSHTLPAYILHQPNSKPSLDIILPIIQTPPSITPYKPTKNALQHPPHPVHPNSSEQQRRSSIPFRPPQWPRPSKQSRGPIQPNPRPIQHAHSHLRQEISHANCIPLNDTCLVYPSTTHYSVQDTQLVQWGAARQRLPALRYLCQSTTGAKRQRQLWWIGGCFPLGRVLSGAVTYVLDLELRAPSTGMRG